MKTKSILTTAAITGLAVGYILASNYTRNGTDKKDRSSFRYNDEDAIRRAGSRGMAQDYRDMENVYGKDLKTQRVGIA